MSDLNQFVCSKWYRNISREILSTELVDTAITREIIWQCPLGNDMFKVNEIQWKSIKSSFRVKLKTAGVYLFKVINRNTKTMCSICSKLNNKDSRATSMTSSWFLYCQLWTDFTLCFGVSIVDFGQVNSRWESTFDWWHFYCCYFVIVKDTIKASFCYCHTLL